MTFELMLSIVIVSISAGGLFCTVTGAFLYYCRCARSRNLDLAVFAFGIASLFVAALIGYSLLALP